MGTKRVFVMLSVNKDSETAKLVKSIQEKLSVIEEPIELEDYLHMTLIGGEITENNYKKLLDKLNHYKDVILSVGASTVGIDTFTSKRNDKQVLKITCKSMTVDTLGNALKSLFDEIMFPEFRPHITIAYLPKTIDTDKLRQSFDSVYNDSVRLTKFDSIVVSLGKGSAKLTIK